MGMAGWGIFKMGHFGHLRIGGDPTLESVLHGQIWGPEKFFVLKGENLSIFVGKWSIVQALILSGALNGLFGSSQKT